MSDAGGIDQRPTAKRRSERLEREFDGPDVFGGPDGDGDGAVEAEIQAGVELRLASGLGDGLGLPVEDRGEAMRDAAVGALAEAIEVMQDDVLQDEVDELELLEFLAADLDPVHADPAFKRELSERLWEMVTTGRFPRPSRH